MASQHFSDLTQGFMEAAEGFDALGNRGQARKTLLSLSLDRILRNQAKNEAKSY